MNPPYLNLLQVIDGSDLIADAHADQLVAGLKYPRVDGLVPAADSRHDLQGEDPQFTHGLGRQDDVGHRLRCTIKSHPLHPVNLQQFPLDKLRIFFHLLIGVTFGCHRVEHPVDIAEVIDDHGGLHSLRQFGHRSRNLATQKFPPLWNLLLRNCHFQLHRDHRNILFRLRHDQVKVGKGAQFILQDGGHLQLHLMGRSSGINGNHPRLHDDDLGIFQLADTEEGEDTSHYNGYQQEVEDRLPLKYNFGNMHHNSPPTLVSVVSCNRVTCSPS